MMDKTIVVATVLIAAAALLLPSAAAADHPSWQQRSASYRVHLGVVPAAQVAKHAALRQSHAGVDAKGPNSRHLLLAVFRNDDGERVTDALIRAEIVERDLIHEHRSRKQLHAMEIDGRVTYCTFVDLRGNGRYEVHVSIRQPGKSAPETVVFLQEEHDLKG